MERVRGIIFLLLLIGIYACNKKEDNHKIIYKTMDKRVIIGEPLDSNNYFIVPISLLVDSDFNLYILDATDKNIRVYNSEGIFKRTISTEGKGPGELAVPSEMHFNNKQNIIVFDIGLHKFTKFSKGGEFLGSTNFNGKLYKFDIDHNNNYYIEQRHMRFDRNNNDIYYKSDLAIYDSLLNRKSLIDTVEYKKKKLITEPVRMAFPLPYTNDFLWKLKSNGTLLTILTATNNLKLYKNGRLIKDSVIDKKYQVKINSKDKEHYFSDLEIIFPNGSSKVPERIIKQIKFPKFKPYVKEIKIIDNIFFIQSYYNYNKYTMYDFINSKGNVVASTFLLSSIFNNQKLEYNGFIYTTKYDTNGYYIVSKYRLNKIKVSK